MLYDDFSSPTLDTDKWEIRQDTEGQPHMEEYWVDTNLENFHTQQNTIGDRRTYLFPKRKFTTGDIIEYSVDLISYEGNYGNRVLLTGDQYIRIGIIGYNNGGHPAVNEIGKYYVTLEFQENNLALRRETPSDVVFLDNLPLTNSNGNYELYIGSFSGHNGKCHMDYDDFYITN